MIERDGPNPETVCLSKAPSGKVTQFSCPQTEAWPFFHKLFLLNETRASTT